MFKAADIMKADVITVNRQTDIYEAMRILVENNITGLPVVDDDMTLVGLISEKDALRLLYNTEDRPGSVADFMTENVVSFRSDDSLIDITETFIRNNFRRVPIVEDGRVVGIISRKDIIGCILKLRHRDKATVSQGDTGSDA